MEYVLYVALFLPLMGFLGLLFSQIPSRVSGVIASGAVGGSFCCFLFLLWNYISQNLAPHSYLLYHWIPLVGMQADIAFYIDPLSLLMGLIVTGVGFLIHVYALGYMGHDIGERRFFAEMNFFIFSMLLLVLASNLLLLFVGWEGVGLASYLLIGFWYQKPEAAQAATKAFIVNRIGDCGLLLGIILTFSLFGSTDIGTITQSARNSFTEGAFLLTLLTLLYFIGAIGKSAQLPLHTWLPDAMAGPTPVSALIHAATMVTAGVYLVTRLHDLFLMTPFTLYVVGAVGAATALFAAICAVGQTDLKRVLAYSTVSQLGLMFLACGVGAFYAAMFHLTTHAFVKALLFLSAGNVVHMMEGNTMMDKMGGLRARFPKTHGLFLIGVLALSGIPPFAAFFSKEMILEEEFLAGFNLLFAMGLITSILTAFYLTRAYCLTFTGAFQGDKAAFLRIKEAPRVMLIPVSVLAFLAIGGGFLGFNCDHDSFLELFLGKVGITLPYSLHSNCWRLTPETWAALLGAFGGVGVAALLYTRYRYSLKGPLAALQRGFYFDELYRALFLCPLKGGARLIAHFFEPKLFYGMLEGVIWGTKEVAMQAQKTQSGQIRSYAAWMAIGAAVYMGYLLW